MQEGRQGIPAVPGIGMKGLPTGLLEGRVELQTQQVR